MQLNKKATVLLPVYNAEDYIEEAIKSILNQTYKDFDVLLIDDGSTDSSANLISKFKDSRIVYIKNEQNLGITKTLNKGLDMIDSEYVIRMDSDDICDPSRFEEQIKFMDKNLTIAVAGTNIRKISADGLNDIPTIRSEPKQLRTELLFNCPLRHPSVIMRNNILKNGEYYYSTQFKATEDYGLWQEIAEKHDIANIDKVLLQYRIHEAGITVQANKNREKRDNAHIIIYKKIFDKLGIDYTAEQLTYYRKFITYDLDFNAKNSEILGDLLIAIRNKLTPDKYDLDCYDKLISKFFRTHFQVHNKSARTMLEIYRKHFKDVFKLNVADIAKLNIRNIQKKLK